MSQLGPDNRIGLNQECVVNSRRAIILIVAIAVGALATAALFSYTRNLEDSVYAEQETSLVWVVTQQIPKGTSAERAINEGFIAQVEVPVALKPATAIAEPSNQLQGLVAVIDLPINHTLVTGNFVAPAVVATGITDRLKESEEPMVTVTFTVDQVGGVAYLLEPGDFVNVIHQYPIEEVPEDAASAEPDILITEQGTDRSEFMPYNFDARYVYQRAEILAIDKELPADLGDAPPAEGAEGAAPAAVGNRGLITLLVPPEAAQELLSIGIDNLYLSLVPPTYVPEALEPLDLGETVLPGEDPRRLTPYGPNPLADVE